jgi:hypothetical protein
MYDSLARQRILFIATAFATLGSMLVATTSFAQSSTGCRAYAEDYASAMYAYDEDRQIDACARARRAL